MRELAYGVLTEDAKREICAWKYDGGYAIYNLPSYAQMQAQQTGFMSEKATHNYYGFWDEDELVGFVNILEEKQRFLSVSA